MNRNEGIVAGAVLLFGALLHTGSTHTPLSMMQSASTNSKVLGPKLAMGDGPWVASCKYWEPTRALDQMTKDGSGKANIEVAVKARLRRKSQLYLKRRRLSANGKEMPGITLATAGRVKANITAIVAGVPDPVHTHLALSFDRDIDALTQAAADNHYLVSYYWLPWRTTNDTIHAESAAAKDEEDEKRKREELPRVERSQAYCG